MSRVQRFLALLLLLVPMARHPAAAQSVRGVSLAAGAHALTVPWHPGPMTDRLNPALLAGADRTLRSSEHWRVFWGMNVGFFRHHWWMTGLSLEPEIGIGRAIPGGLQTDLRLGLGYMHYFWRRKTLELENGRYVPSSGWGEPSLSLPLTMTLGYRGDADSPNRAQPFVAARWTAQGLFLSEAPVMTHFFLLGGIRLETGDGPSEGGR